MTTIACDGETMAGDGQREHRGTITNRSAIKVRRLDDGSLYGTAGCVAFGDQMIEWIAKGGEKPKMEGEDGFASLHLKAEGELYFIGPEGVPSRIEAPYAVGSGMDIAIGAMHAGASPQRAVEIAAMCDPCTGGTITELSI